VLFSWQYGPAVHGLGKLQPTGQKCRDERVVPETGVLHVIAVFEIHTAASTRAVPNAHDMPLLRSKCIPDSATTVPPELGPVDGETLVAITGGCLYRNCMSLAVNCKLLLVTSTDASPSARAGGRPCSSRWLTYAAGTCKSPNRQCRFPEKTNSVPLTVTTVPPCSKPLVDEALAMNTAE
jgi:hypothetical protein